MATEVVQSTNDVTEKVKEDRPIVTTNSSNANKNLAKNNSNSGSKRNKNNQGDKKRDNHHHRRKPSKKKRKWKPYSKMTWEEKKAVEEREKKRADRIRGEMLDRGRPVAPYNTTQFIMAEHDPYEEDSVLDSGYRGNDSSNQGLNDEDMDESIEAEYTDSPHMAPEFISQDFSEAYERVQEESLSIMTRDDLVKEHLSLERNLSYLQGKLAEEKSMNNSYSVKVENLEEELEKLRNDNERLVRENVRLVYGNDAADETSDYEYEVPTSDQDAIKYSEDYNDISEQSTDAHNRGGGNEAAAEPPDNKEECKRDTPTSIPSRSSSDTLDSLQTDGSCSCETTSCSSCQSNETGGKYEKQGNAPNITHKNDTKGCLDDQIQTDQSKQVSSTQSPKKRKNETDNSSSSPGKGCHSPNSKTRKGSSSSAPYPCDFNIPETNLQDPISNENSRTSPEVKKDNDVIMQSLKSEESMDAASFASEEKMSQNSNF